MKNVWLSVKKEIKMYVTKRTANCHRVTHNGFSKVYFSNRIEAIAQFWRDYNKENIK